MHMLKLCVEDITLTAGTRVFIQDKLQQTARGPSLHDGEDDMPPWLACVWLPQSAAYGGQSPFSHRLGLVLPLEWEGDRGGPDPDAGQRPSGRVIRNKLPHTLKTI